MAWVASKETWVGQENLCRSGMYLYINSHLSGFDFL
jgi:hypothetical protein